MNKVISIMGPTSAGKTGLAMELVKAFPLEIISVDSAQVYRGLDIGSGKPTMEELSCAPHRLIDIRDPSEPYSAAQFVEDANKAMADIRSYGKVPLLVGGTMLYFKALFQGLNTLPPADQAVRDEISDLADRKGWPAVHAELASVDAETASRLHPNDRQRLQRALEVFKTTGKTMSQYRSEQLEQHGDWSANIEASFPRLDVALIPGDRRRLHQQIALRFEHMLQTGLIKEVEALRARRELTVDLPSIRSVGYKQVWEYLSGDYGLDEMQAKAIAATRQLAKRQLTWLRGWSVDMSVDPQVAGWEREVLLTVEAYLNE